MTHRPRLLLLVLAAGLSGCFTVETSLKADGSGTMRMTYFPPANSTVASETKRLASSHVTVESVQVSTKGAVAQLKFDDVTALSGSEAFKGVTVTRTREGEEESLRASIRNTFARSDRDTLERHAREHPEREGPRFELTLPGKVAQANRDATVTENRVVWKISLLEYAQTDVLDLDVRYATAGAPPPAEKPAGAPAGESPPPTAAPKSP